MNLDINDFRGIVTATLLGLFIWLIAWAWSKARRPAFDAAAQLPLEEDAPLDTEVRK